MYFADRRSFFFCIKHIPAIPKASNWGISPQKNYVSRDLQSTIPLMVFDLWGDAIKPRIQITQRLQAMVSEILVLANAAVPWQFLTNTTKVPVTKVLDPEASTGNTESP